MKSTLLTIIAVISAIAAVSAVGLNARSNADNAILHLRLDDIERRQEKIEGGSAPSSAEAVEGAPEIRRRVEALERRVVALEGRP